MKKILFLITFVLTTIFSYGQTPQDVPTILNFKYGFGAGTSGFIVDSITESDTAMVFWNSGDAYVTSGGAAVNWDRDSTFLYLSDSNYIDGDQISDSLTLLRTKDSQQSDSLLTLYGTVSDAFTEIGLIKIRNDDQTDSLIALYDTAALHKDTLQLHASQIASILSDLDTKLEVTDTINHAVRSDTTRILELPDGKIVNDSTDLGSDSVVYSETSGFALDHAIQDTLFISASDNFIHEIGSGSLGMNVGGTGIMTIPSTPGAYMNFTGNGFNQNMIAVFGSTTLPTYTFASDNNTGIGRTDADQLGLFAGGTAINWNGSRLVTEGGDTVQYKSDPGTGGTSDSSSITYEVDTVKAFNNSDIFINDHITLNDNRFIDFNSNGRLTANGSQLELQATSVVEQIAGGGTMIWDGSILRTANNDTVPYKSDIPGMIETYNDTGTVSLSRTEQTWDSISFSSTINLDFTSGSDYKMVGITGDCTINFIDMPAGESVVWLIYDGAHTVTKGTNWDNADNLKGGGSLDETSGAINIIQLQKAVGPGGYEKIVHMILN